MEILAYIVLIALTFFGITNRPVIFSMRLFPPGTLIGNVSAIPIAWLVWKLIDIFIWLPLFNKPIPIALFLSCWIAKLIDDIFQEKMWHRKQTMFGNMSIHNNMAEAWVLFVWAIIAMFGDYRTWF